MSAIVNANDLLPGDLLDFNDVAYNFSVWGITHPVEGFAEALSVDNDFRVATVVQTKFRKNARTKVVLEVKGEKFNLTLDDESELRVLNDN